MRAPTVLGSYMPGTSPVHKLDPRVKLALAVAFVVVTFAASGWTSLILCVGTVAAMAAIARVPAGWLVRSLTPVLPLLVITIVLNAFGRAGAPGVLIALGPVAVIGPGLARGLFFAVRIATMIGGTALLALTTSPRSLADAMAFFGRPLALVRVPVDDLAMMMTIALRFLPTLAEEIAQVVRARMARGADFSGPIWRRASTWSSVLVPLFVGLFRRADELALAMEARGYRPGRRPRLHPPRMCVADVAVAAAGAAWLVFVLLGPAAWRAIPAF